MFVTGAVVAALVATTSASIFRSDWRRARARRSMGRDPRPTPTARRDFSLLFGADQRTQQLEDISASAAEVSARDARADRNFKVAVSSLALSGVGALTFAPITLAAVPGLVYIFVPRIREAVDVLINERRVKSVVLNAVIATGLLLSGQFFALALTYTFLTLSRKMLNRVEDHSLDQVAELFEQQPRSVWLVVESNVIEVPFDSVQPGDVIAVQAGDMVPVDGVIAAGVASIDQRMLTGEAQPAEKEPGDPVFAATLVLSGRIHIVVENAGSDTVAAQVTQTLNRTADFKRHIEWRWSQWLDRSAAFTMLSGAVSLPFVGPVGALSVLYAVNFGYSMRFIAPLTMINFLNVASRDSILIKDGRALEALSHIDTVVFDKTGTLTEEQPTVSLVHTLGECAEDALLLRAAAAEQMQSHPIALAILAEARQRDLDVPTIDATRYQIGYGLEVKLGAELLRVGSARFMEMEGLDLPSAFESIRTRAHALGHSLVCIAVDDRVEGAIELAPTIRPEAAGILDGLRARGMSLHIISGDHEAPTRRLADALGIESVFAETLPEDKARIIAQLRSEGRRVCFVGDGINDSIALKQADLSISLSGATSIATDTAQVILMDGSLRKLGEFFEVGDALERNVRTSLLLTCVPTVLSIGGIFLLNAGIIPTILLYYAGLGAGVANAMTPVARPRPARAEASA